MPPPGYLLDDWSNPGWKRCVDLLRRLEKVLLNDAAQRYCERHLNREHYL